MTAPRPVMDPTAGRSVVFLINLVQDVNIVRGIAYLAARETDARIRFFVSQRFFGRDAQGIWRDQIAAMAQDLGADIHTYGEAAEAFAALQGGAGMIFAASESSLSAHSDTTDVFRVAPSSYLTVTLQHGFECVGFLQNREHVIAHGRNITWGADIVCSWSGRAELTTSTAASQRSKLYVTGPSTLLQRPTPGDAHPPVDGGMICENLHSVRLRASGNHGASFMEIFSDFCADLARRDRRVTLRPHPGGQYVLKNNVALPDNVTLNNLPIYNVDLGRYHYGVSAPSTIVTDMVLAGIPTAVWTDPGGVMDAGNYGALTQISTLEDWIAFERDAELRPDMILARQKRYLDGLGLVTDRDEIYRRFARLLINGLGAAPLPEVWTEDSAPVPPAATPPSVPATVPAVAARAPRRRHILFVSNGMIPTLQLSFLKPLSPLFSNGTFTHEILTETDIIDRFGTERRSGSAGDWFEARLREAKPDLIVCSRYSGPHPDRILKVARETGAPVIYHVDDDLLNIPPEIGEKKYRIHSDPKRTGTVAELLGSADLVYCSTPALKQRFRTLGFTGPMVAGRIYCASRLLREPSEGPTRRIGYMGFDHAHDFEIALPALVSYMHRHPEVNFELFGSIPMPDTLAAFGARVTVVEPVRDYAEFLLKLAERAWDIGIAPLVRSPFNAVKANTKWVEYTSAGMATIASRGLVYDDCAGGGRGLLVGDEGWEAALDLLTDRPDLRRRIAGAAQTHVLLGYSDAALRAQILSVFDHADALKRSGDAGAAPPDLSGLRRALTPEALRDHLMPS
ncbi:hypothetical protein ATO6_22690 [Oceanicola sp. 22II-s10i]|uniref:hypothetical protein n=1 Tax=Oceanicola sp. 22II-s10i TaxID=1317116 RepID=UPI000B5241EE|nr:hypothetical protein [Oceanicola sp. 22II-s10i]OWU82253.1 hypothetical protein ATO6_22690 [Oceanicola sp. 22II-s10i]